MLTNKQRLVFKIVLFTSSVLAASLGVYLAVCMFANITNYFIEHFAMGIVLILISFVAFTLPILTKKKYQDDAKDKVMFMVGVLLVMLSILTIIISYLNIF